MIEIETIIVYLFVILGMLLTLPISLVLFILFYLYILIS